MTIENRPVKKLRTRLLATDGGKPDYWLMGVVALLLILGTIMVYSASFVTAAVTDGNPTYYLWRHLLWVGVGLAGGFVMFQVDYHKWRQISIVLMVLVLLMLLGVLVLPAQFAPSIAGARRWLSVSSDSNWLLQPSEVAKLALILYGGYWLSSKGDKVRNFYYGLVPFALTVGILIGLIMGEPDLGTSLVIGAIGMTMFFVAGANIIHLLVGLGAAGGGFYILATTAAYRLNRLTAYQDPFSDPTGLGYHTTQSLIGLGSGGLWGMGLGVSRQKFFWLPTVFTDSIFAVIGEELGLVGTSFVVLLFLAFAWRGFKVAIHAPDGFGRLIACGVTVYVVAQAFLNISVVTNLVPFTGIPLPFLSYGGSSLSVTLLALGLLLNVSRQQVENPRLVEIEERRQQINKERLFQRAQRQAKREARELALKQRETRTAQEQTVEISEAEKRWSERNREERRTARQLEEAEKQERERVALAVRRRVELERVEYQVTQPVLSPEVPAVARQSFLDYQPDNFETPAKPDREAEKPGVKLQRPRTDWAKIYRSAAQKKRSSDD